ncbi:MAG: flippase [Bacilli bacterium]
MHNKFIVNTVWIVGGKIFQMFISLIVSMLVTRYLGPSNFGIINYASSIVAFFTSFCSLGLSAIIVKELVNNRDKEGEILGTSIVMRLVASFISFLLIIVLIYSIKPDDKLTIIVVILQSISLLFNAFDIFVYWYQSNLQSKYITIAQTIAYIFMTIYKIIILISQKGVEWFAFSTSLDIILIAIILMLFYKKNSGDKLTFNKKWIKVLLRQSYPFIVSGIMLTIYGQMDKIMIGEMMDTTSVGLYSVAITITGIWSFIPIAFIESARPIIMEKKRQNDNAMYITRIKQLYAFIIWMCIFYGIFITFFSKYIILILYGENYIGAAPALSIVVWYCAFSYLGSAKNIWLICENKNKYEQFFTFTGAITNVILNFLLIPQLGIVGAALATLITQIVTNVLLLFLFRETRENGILIVESFLLKGVKIKELFKTIKFK